MEPGEFIKVLDQNGQIPGMIGEVARSKALAVALGKVKVVDSNGNPVDLSEFTAAAAAEVENPVELPEEDPTGAAYDDHEGHSH
jgi:trigger factor